MKQFGQYNIPISWEEISIKNQLAVESLSKEHPDLLPLCIVSGYAGIPFDEIRKMPIVQVKGICDALTFIGTPLPVEPISEFEYKGEKYSVVETLLKQEAQDFLTLTSIEGRKDSLLYVIAVLSKKLINGKYESLSDFDIEKRAQHFQDLPLTVANRIHVFFCLTSAVLSIDSNQVLNQYDQSINESINYMLTIQKPLGGGGLFSRWLMGILQSYLRFLKRNWTLYYSGLQSETEKPNWITKFKRLFKKKQKRK